MPNEVWVRSHLDFYRHSSDYVLFDIVKKDWRPSIENLQKFYETTYFEIVDKHKELEKTQEYILTGEVLYAKGCVTGKELALVVGEGFTYSESSATHSIGWGLKGLFDKFKEKPQPFNLDLLIVGYKNPEALENMPVLNEFVGMNTKKH